MHFVPVKSVTQQAQGMVLKIRETLVGQRTSWATRDVVMLPNSVCRRQRLHHIGPLLSAIEQEATSRRGQRHVRSSWSRDRAILTARIKEIDVKLNAAHKANEVSQRLATIPGIGRVIALTLSTEIDPSAFESGRHLAAWAGLTPKEFDRRKATDGEISRAGNERLRACSSLARPR